MELSPERMRLKIFLEENIPVNELIKVGYFPKGTRKTDYEKIAEIVCQFFGYKSIYEYKQVCNGRLCSNTNCDGSNKYCRNGNYKGDMKPFTPDLAEIITQEKWLN